MTLEDLVEIYSVGANNASQVIGSRTGEWVKSGKPGSTLDLEGTGAFNTQNTFLNLKDRKSVV